jgi:hypothetical protein
MLWNASMMKGYVVLGHDGSLGTVSDLLFDDSSWKRPSLVVSTATGSLTTMCPCLCPS